MNTSKKFSAETNQWLRDLADLKAASDKVFRMATARNDEEQKRQRQEQEDSDSDSDSDSDEIQLERAMKRRKIRLEYIEGRELRRLERSERIEQLKGEIFELNETLSSLKYAQEHDID